jgi:hypothetical protein
MIHDFQWKGVQIDKVTGNVQRSNLSSAIIKYLVSRGKSIQQQCAEHRAASFRDKVLIHCKMLFALHKRPQEIFFGLRDNVMALQIQQ